MEIKHIFFDLDHTLWDFETNSKKTFDYIFKRNQLDLDIDEFVEVYQPINHKYWKLFREDKVSKVDLRYYRLKEAFDQLNYSAEDDMIDLLSEEYITYLADHNNLFDYTHELLTYLQPKYAMHIITNGFEEVQLRKLKSSNLMPYFDHVITSEGVGVKKPNPKIFHYALELTGAQKGQSMMIGDNFEADILGAKKVGMHTIYCKFNGQPEQEQTMSVSHLKEIELIL